MKKIRNGGFALPTILISSIILLGVLVTAISATVAIRSSLREARYENLASLAAEAGNVYAKSCLANNNNQVTWTSQKPLKPNTNCQGNTVPSLSQYLIENDDYRTYFVVDVPESSNINAKGFIETLRSSSGVVWRTWTSDSVSAISSNDSLPVGSSVEGYWTSPPPGYLLENGAEVSRITYADLFAVIGTTFGAGNGSTTFNLPNSEGRVTVNQQATDTYWDVLGETRGANTRTLTESQLPRHRHWVSSAAVDDRNFTGTGLNTQVYGLVADAGSYSANDPLSTYGRYTDYAGSASPTGVDIIQKSIVVLRVIKY